MKWYRYRTKWSSGNSTWTFDFVTDNSSSDTDMTEHIGEIIGDQSWSEHYRGFDWEWAQPTRDIVEKHIAETAGRISSLTKQLEALKEYHTSITPT